MVKKLTLLLCMVILLALVACKQDTDSHQSNNSALSETVGSNQQNAISGIELEEDVFDDSDDTQNPIQSNQTSITSSKDDTSLGNTTGSTESDSKKEDEADKSLSSDGSNTEKTEDSSSDNNSSNTSSEDVTVEDGVIKLPIDKFD